MSHSWRLGIFQPLLGLLKLLRLALDSQPYFQRDVDISRGLESFEKAGGATI